MAATDRMCQGRRSGRPTESVSLWLEDELKKLVLRMSSEGRDSLPSERELSGIYGVNRLTLRKVLKKLADDQLITHPCGKDRFVNRALFDSYSEMRKTASPYRDTPLNSTNAIRMKMGIFDYSGNNKISWDEQIQRFSESMPGVDILPRLTTNEELSPSGGVDSLPDVFNVKASDIPELAEKGFLFAMDDLCERFFSCGAPFEKRLLDACRHKGKLYALPQEASVPVVYCNKGLLKQISGVDASGKNLGWEELASLASAASEKLHRGPYLISIPCVYLLLLSFGVFKPDGEYQSSEYMGDRALAMAKWIGTMSRIPSSLHVSIIDKADSLSQFMAGRIALYVQGTYLAPSIRAHADFETEILPLPTSGGGTGDLNTVGLAIRRNSDFHLHACRWLTHILSEENQNALALRGGDVPARVKAITTAYPHDSRGSAALREFAAARRNVLPNAIQWKLERDVWTPEFMRLWNGSQSPEETLRNMKNGHEFLEKLRY